MYRRGMLRTPTNCPHELDENGHCPEWCSVYAEQVERRSDVEAGQFYLPHSCDEWIIGGREELRLLIADAQRYLEDA